ncbi:YrhB domain-containing protein [Nocardia carnea]|uniref:YrhB domain-containing protein n=1 Tax=Nocardia carnea TaxID=37328 RepID=UPI0024555647|nr:YrhB domain-containing protein [Nocardia carnea]
MISKHEAEQIARRYVSAEFPPREGAENIVIDDTATIERPYGWLFTYTTERYTSTHDPDDGLAGAGPILVLRAAGEIILYNSIYTSEAALADYEQQSGMGHAGTDE